MNASRQLPRPLLRLGRIGYLNVLPIYHALETGEVEGHYQVASGPPAELNRLMAAGALDVSAASSIEYARRPEEYLLVPDLAIGSCGPVRSVLLLSRGPVGGLGGETILVSSQTHTSAALLKVLLADNLRLETSFRTGDATSLLAEGQRPAAILAIGDEALNLRRHPDYPHCLDLGECWREWTGLPFIFGVWIVRERSLQDDRERVLAACRALQESKRRGLARLPELCALAAQKSLLNENELREYFAGLVYDLDERQQLGLKRFFAHLASRGIISTPPPLRFLEMQEDITPSVRCATTRSA
jgi:chorismate dehydratase